MVRVDDVEGVAVLRFDRPPANAIDLEVVAAFQREIDQVVSGGRASALVLTGRPGWFSAGLDLKVVPTYAAEQQRAMVAGINRTVRLLYGAPLPVVAALTGHAVAGGLVFALACDYRVGTAGRFAIGLTESRVGIPYPAAAITVVRAELAPPAARRLVLVGRNMGPDEAHALGVLDEVVPEGETLERALAVARDLASGPRAAYAAIKRQLREEALARIARAAESGDDPALAAWLSAETPAAASNVLRGA